MQVIVGHGPTATAGIADVPPHMTSAQTVCGLAPHKWCVDNTVFESWYVLHQLSKPGKQMLVYASEQPASFEAKLIIYMYILPACTNA